MMRLNLHRKILYAFLALAILPLILLALNSNYNLHAMGVLLRSNTSTAIDSQLARAQQLRAQMVAAQVRGFLHAVEGDVRDLAMLPPRPEVYLRFSRQHQGSIWFRAGTDAAPVAKREKIPLFSELAFIAPDGREKVRIVEGRISHRLRDVADPANTTYRSEDYFAIARHMPPNVIYTTPLTGWHISKEQQLRGATSPERAVQGAKYRGVIRFAKTVYGKNGRLRGIVLLSLDQRHLMEFTQHISPTQDKAVVFPPVDSGNYAFMFDSAGWIITNPRFWTIRGLNRSGKLVPPYTASSSPRLVARGIIPINLYYAGFLNPNYPAIARAVLDQKRSGVMDVTTEDGIKKIAAFAPIYYFGAGTGDPWIFGGVVIVTAVKKFHQPAEHLAALIHRKISDFLRESWLMIGVSLLLVFAAAYLLSQHITGPLLALIQGTRRMAKGDLATEVPVSSADEVGELSHSFNAMARELDMRRERLMGTLEDLRRSRREILRERNFKETIVENIETGILTLDAAGQVTSANSPARATLALPAPAAALPLAELLSAWPEIAEALRAPLAGPGSANWSQYLYLERDGRQLTFRLALFPLALGAEGGRILTIEDLTERTDMRRRMERMERLVSLGRLSAGIAHEIRNPLTGVNLLLDELHDRLLNLPEDQALIRRALEEIERLEGLVNELLTFASQPQTALVAGDVGAVLQDTLFLVRKQCEKNGVALAAEIPEALPPVKRDPAKLKQALLNLLNNALEALSGGGALSVAAGVADRQVWVTIRDSGAGIAAERLPLIFEPFFTTKEGGTGLGLAITHNIVSDHGGRLEVQSRTGEGTVFTLWLPVDSPGRAPSVSAKEAGGEGGEHS